MQFVSLANVLWAIARFTDLPNGLKLAEPDDPAVLRNSLEEAARYSHAASLLDYHLANARDIVLPRWLDLRERTGYARPSDCAETEGRVFLLEEAKWIGRYIEYRKRVYMREMDVGGRWAPPLTLADYAEGYPHEPALTAPYRDLVHAIGFDMADIVNFLDRSFICHAFGQSVPEQRLLNSSACDSLSDVNSDQSAIASPTIPSLGDAARRSVSPEHPLQEKRATSKVMAGPKGRRAEIHDALVRAMELAGPDRFDVHVVHRKLIELATDLSKEFYPLAGCDNGRVMFYRNIDGKSVEYTKEQLAGFVGRRRRGEVNI
ncbi:hypothetical protein [Burkholderia sp. BCC1638]|uniref:hypothetical protein n=1 Tax=Burkholderia sp. BCC1638 TaxID=2681391 RepID=UPI001589F764|nr:hypothetical protein [Burkholderia sp. BCC1638]